ncbi:UDP-N-acetylmuramoyl-tripeptide--D-alanyl-D-alanine ligase [Cytophagales bacterium LB-30]|uniref:UDP-N-acetylmuramoyl-tripeptide--D-alanyl-D-alanine ligase n=2 Tax=Shiella aurantiaca TaxID=3058365 RepID=A0ABT8F6T2_9BACT|nr:UDP-N-acetylmuramoyl-tripeptide--D-alanyl-D-alanine ligase [Shiella aurantiaca]
MTEPMIERLYLRFQESKGVSTDTRNITRGSIFFALKGPNFNANEFAAEALQKGAKYAVVDDAAYSKDGRYIVVPDTLKALQQLALHHRRKFSIPFIAITGSNGKTTSKELIRSVLSQKYITYATQGNLNNHIGVPLTLLQITDDIQIAIIEMGASKQGDIAELCAIAEPTHGIITNIGKAHLEGMGGIEGVIKTKTELYDFLHANEGTVFVNSQHAVLMEHAARFTSPILFPAEHDFYHCEMVEANPFVVLKSEGGDLVRTQMIGSYNFENMAAALCIGKYFDVREQEGLQGILAYVPSNNRSQIVQRGSNTIIQDAYNANPSSMKESLNNFMRMKADHKMVVLGDMLELGTESEAEHCALGELVAQGNFDKVVFYGERMQAALASNPQAYYFTDKFSLRNWISDLKLSNYHILIKGSRSMGLEQVVEAI